jgi:hypothetical protein
MGVGTVAPSSAAMVAAADAGERRDAVDQCRGVCVLGVRVVQLVHGVIGARHAGRGDRR